MFCTWYHVLTKLAEELEIRRAIRDDQKYIYSEYAYQILNLINVRFSKEPQLLIVFRCLTDSMVETIVKLHDYKHINIIILTGIDPYSIKKLSSEILMSYTIFYDSCDESISIDSCAGRSQVEDSRLSGLHFTELQIIHLYFILEICKETVEAVCQDDEDVWPKHSSVRMVCVFDEAKKYAHKIPHACTISEDRQTKPFEELRDLGLITIHERKNMTNALESTMIKVPTVLLAGPDLVDHLFQKCLEIDGPTLDIQNLKKPEIVLTWFSDLPQLLENMDPVAARWCCRFIRLFIAAKQHMIVDTIGEADFNSWLIYLVDNENSSASVETKEK